MQYTKPDPVTPDEPHPRQRLILRLRRDTVSRMISMVDPHRFGRSRDAGTGASEALGHFLETL